jgi:hypothetical protein
MQALKGAKDSSIEKRAAARVNEKKVSSLINKPKFQRAARPDHTCKDEVGLIADFLAGWLDPTVLVAFEKHLGQCPDCAAFLNTYKKTIEATKSFLRNQTVKISPKPLRLPPKGPGSLAMVILVASFYF